jgi:hypothetical protein
MSLIYGVDWRSLPEPSACCAVGCKAQAEADICWRVRETDFAWIPVCIGCLFRLNTLWSEGKGIAYRKPSWRMNPPTYMALYPKPKGSHGR